MASKKGSNGGKKSGEARPAEPLAADPDAGEITEQFLTQLNAKKTAIERSITAVNLSTKTINALTDQSRLAVGDEVQRVSSQLAEVVKSAQAQANQGKKLLDAIKKEGEEEMRRDKKSARIQAYTAQYTRLCKVYVDAMKEHQRAKEALRKTQVDGVVRQGMSLPQNENKSEAEVRREVELAGPAAFLQSALMEEASDEAQAAYMDAESRAKDIDLLMRSINDVAALFQDLAVLVQEQSAQLDTIEVHVQAASKHIRKGNEALRDTIAYQKKNRKCFCCVICILVVVVLAITIGVGAFYGTKKA